MDTGGRNRRRSIAGHPARPGAFQASIEQLAALDFDRVVPAHGTIVEIGGRELLFAALRDRGFAPRQAPPLAPQQ